MRRNSPEAFAQARARGARLVDAWFAASRRWPVAFHFN